MYPSIHCPKIFPPPAAELLDGWRALGHQHTADLGRTGERSRPLHDPVRRLSLAPISLAVCRSATENTPGGMPARFAELGDRQRGERRLGRRLADEGAAGSERRAGLAGDHRVGEIPRRDRRDDAERLLDRQLWAGVRPRRGDRFAVDAPCPPRRRTRQTRRHRRFRRAIRQAASPARRS